MGSLKFIWIYSKYAAIFAGDLEKLGDLETSVENWLNAVGLRRSETTML
jgi:hypothetical protein